MPEQIGTGFFTTAPVDPAPYEEKGWRAEKIGIYTNFHATHKAWDCSFRIPQRIPLTVDGFSPNLNKELHIGHLRNLALAASVSKITYAHPVALLGASLGVVSSARDALYRWIKLARYEPSMYYDVLMPIDLVNIEEPIDHEHAGCKVWNGPNGSVIVMKSNGQRTYAFHDLAFAKEVSPNYYITGSEQKGHFASLGLAEKHLPMGLVSGLDGKKMKSRAGDSLSASDALALIEGYLRKTPDKEKLAWNILVWNFLSVSREKNIKFDPETWISDDSPGMYISYTYARTYSALKTAILNAKSRILEIGREYGSGMDYKKSLFAISSMAAPNQLEDVDIELACTATYMQYYLNRSIKLLDPCPLANYALLLAKKMTTVYQKHKISSGRSCLQTSVDFALSTLEVCMNLLGMYPLNKI